MARHRNRSVQLLSHQLYNGVHRTGEIWSKTNVSPGTSPPLQSERRTETLGSARRARNWMFKGSSGAEYGSSRYEKSGAAAHERSGDATRCELISAVRSIIVQKKSPDERGAKFGRKPPRVGASHDKRGGDHLQRMKSVVHSNSSNSPAHGDPRRSL